MLKPFRQFLFIRLRNRQHGRREEQLNNFEQTCLHSFNQSRQLTQDTRIYVYFKKTNATYINWLLKHILVFSTGTYKEGPD